MKNSFILVCIVILCFVTLVSSVPLTSIESININVTKNVNKNININITNPNSFVLTKIKIEGTYVASNEIAKLEPGETKILSVTINVPVVGDVSSTLNIIGFREVDCSITPSDTHDISITPSGTTPNSIDICTGDSVRYTNNFGQSVRVVIVSLGQDTLLAVGDSFVPIFANAGVFTYRIEPLIDLGIIDVSNVIQLIHNSQDDGSVILNIKSSLEETTTTINFNSVDFTMSFNEVRESFLIIKNTGTKPAENIKFFGDWFSFDQNGITLVPGVERAINFVISPIINSGSETNMSYQKIVTITSDNIQTFTQNITIFIEHSIVAGGNISSPDWWIKRKLFCDTFPTAPDCLTEPLIIFRDKQIFDCPAILANISPKDVQTTLQECNVLRGDFSDFANVQKLDMTTMKDAILSILGSDKSLNQTISNNTSELVSFRNTFYFVVATILLGIIIYGVYYIGMKYYRIKERDSVGVT